MKNNLAGLSLPNKSTADTIKGTKEWRCSRQEFGAFLLLLLFVCLSDTNINDIFTVFKNMSCIIISPHRSAGMVTFIIIVITLSLGLKFRNKT